MPASPTTCTSTPFRAGGRDTNFMPVIGLTRVLPQVLSETRGALAAAWSEQAVAVGEA